MTVKELMKLLMKFDDDAVVVAELEFNLSQPVIFDVVADCSGNPVLVIDHYKA